MMKNSEWGAIAYLTQSKYGIYDQEIAVNKHDENSGGTSQTKEEGNNLASVYAVTGYNNNEKKWNEYLGEESSPSTTGNIYGIYDLAGGATERSTGYINNGDSTLSRFGSPYTTGSSNQYATVYPYNDEGVDDAEKGRNNYKLNTKIYGDAIKETSTDGMFSTSWRGDYSYYPRSGNPFFTRGGSYTYEKDAGSLAFNYANGYCSPRIGFRCILI